jgi:hypothetical protein
MGISVMRAGEPAHHGIAKTWRDLGAMMEITVPLR